MFLLHKERYEYRQKVRCIKDRGAGRINHIQILPTVVPIVNDREAGMAEDLDASIHFLSIRCLEQLSIRQPLELPLIKGRRGS